MRKAKVRPAAPIGMRLCAAPLAAPLRCTLLPIRHFYAPRLLRRTTPDFTFSQNALNVEFSARRQDRTIEASSGRKSTMRDGEWNVGNRAAGAREHQWGPAAAQWRPLSPDHFIRSRAVRSG
jgi:hypothetical protein